ncbi:PLP-dependent transferase [Pluteus cervinus]|uniref:PLP-dependent transferase n=1 Tax=Pluteus cervinus TaxID=181527 RepID=A0ACD3AXD6_9AGAR|nr:PLP-dependent transferase [Pluteus cervinus]
MNGNTDGSDKDTLRAQPNGSACGVSPSRLPPEFYDAFLSTAAKERKPCPIRGLFPLESTPGLISLLAGKPNATTFPFTSLSFTARSPIDDSPEAISLTETEFAEALQYGATDGLGQLRNWIVGLQEFSHDRKHDGGWKVSIGTGSQDLIYKAVAATVNQGDPVLVESPVYAGVLPIFQGHNCELVAVETDSCGIQSSSLRSILENWPVNKPRPKILYTVPYGCNPTGMTATLERRKEVLRLAREYNILILEDDPYYYLYYGDGPRYPSYFALELEEPEVGRVLRFDSLSKILSAGLRIGFASGPEPLIQAIDRHTTSLNLQTSTFTQMVAYKLLDAWGYDGFKIHTEKVSAFHRGKRDIFERVMNKHLSGLAQWSSPEAGMFFWFKLILSEGDKVAEDGDSEAIIRTKAFDRGVLALPGTVFMPDGRKTAYVRAAFSLSTEPEVEEALRRLRQVILEARAEAKTVGEEQGKV